ncbi:Glyceraldehyde-3-phosphate dehydrogenase B, chloroplastic [Dendrobium catenatum]|uniref:Glyceraldehyde-3-phosphate dehydrogenase B, chloroplastic n=1 Tax=Dendrobium catenatum TaxID=906689 RepID=A0A2I0VTG2_9ASPA|nr:Glyceraldehyde-3-phosphate dehydrogenase B, chloroplastic [Dendrobium catenatum]
MASHSALASSRIPSTASLRSKQRHEVAEFSGLRSSSSVAFASQTRDQISFSELVAAQLATKIHGSRAVRGETVAKLKVAINGFGRIGRNFLRCWHGRKNSPLDVVVVNDSGGVKNV